MTAINEPLAGDYRVVWQNTDREYYVEGSGLVHWGSENWLAVVPVVPRRMWRRRRATHSRVHIIISDDDGESWHKVSDLPYYSAVPFINGGCVHLFANKGGTDYRNDDLVLLRSRDHGRTWSEPVTLFEGHFWNCHTGMAVRDNRLYWAVDDLSFGQDRGPRVVSCDLSCDLLQKESWRLSNAVPFPGVPETLINPVLSDRGHSEYLEPNVINVNGQLRLLATVKLAQQSTTGLCAVFDVEDDGNALHLDFTQFHPMPGGQLKFCVERDPVSGLFWATVNLPADGQDAMGWEEQCDARTSRGGNDRRFLMLMYGVDGLNWFPAGCVARAAKLSQSFMYPRHVIAGENLGILSRSSIEAPNRHDADCACFHKVTAFRELAMDLQPEKE